MKELDKSMLLKMYTHICEGRFFEDKLMDMYMKGEIGGLFHPGTGEEACGAGTVMALDPGDFLGLHHRNHTHAFTRGLDMKRVLCETLCKEPGYNQGRAGDFHYIDVADNVYVLGGTLGPCFTIPNGVAFMYQQQKNGKIAVAYTGDSATAEGAFHEGLNLAKALHLPVLFIIQNNTFGGSADIRTVTGGIHHMSTRAKAYEIPSKTIDGNDVEEVYWATKEAADYVRSGNGPYVLELMTWRQYGHGPSDPGAYKDPEENAAWLKRDPILLLEAKLKDKFHVTEEELQAIKDDVKTRVNEAVAYAQAAPYASDFYTHVYAEA